MKVVKGKPITYSVEQRLRMIDFLVYNYGNISRGILIDYFAISPACATRDFKLYQEMFPDNVVLDNSSKRYLKAPFFTRGYK